MYLIKGNRAILNEVKSLILILSDEQFVKPISVLSSSSLGQHFRHIIEFYIELEKGILIDEVCYDRRARDLNIELNKSYAIQTIEKLISFIDLIKEDKALFFIANYDVNIKQEDKIKSSLYRELANTLEHTIHHLAIIKIGFNTLSIEIDKNIGVAPSTIRNRKDKCAQ